MDSWTTTLRLLVVMAAIAVFYVLGRLVAEGLRGVSFNGGLPGV